MMEYYHCVRQLFLLLIENKTDVVDHRVHHATTVIVNSGCRRLTMAKYVDINAAKEAVRRAECDANWDERVFDAEFIENALDFIPPPT